MVECLDEVDAVFGILTETWLSDDRELQDKLDDLSCGAGLGLITRNRPINSAGFSHGGVGIVFRESACTFKEVKLPNPDNFEVVVAAARFPGYSRQLVAVACYLPPDVYACGGVGGFRLRVAGGDRGETKIPGPLFGGGGRL